jgi:hypothetical protein
MRVLKCMIKSVALSDPRINEESRIVFHNAAEVPDEVRSEGMSRDNKGRRNEIIEGI